MMFHLAIGSIVGHEIAHGFDELRRHIDKDRKRYTLWSNETIEMFDQRSKCMIEQYNNYTVTQVNLPVGHCYRFLDMN
jgi:predicted metalloendopeptidase